MSEPLVSIITPSFQQAKYIKETIRSVISQDYPNLEYIIVDGGSTDGTVEILKSYGNRDKRIRWISEKDNGQAHAINKGLAMAKGEIIGWLNSDDTYEPHAVRKAVSALMRHPEWGVVYGKGNYIDANSKTTHAYQVEPYSARRLFESCYICQPAAFIRRSVFNVVGPIDESYHFCMDFELWMRISKKFEMGFKDRHLANSRLHPECKSVTQYVSTGLPEIIRACRKHYGSVANEWIMQIVYTYLSKGPLWILKYLKSIRTFGSTHTVSIRNREHDFWVPSRWKIQIENPKLNDLHSLLIQGSHNIPYLSNRPYNQTFSFYYKNKFVRSIEAGKGAFCIEVPLHDLPVSEAITLEVHCSESIVPAESGHNGDTRRLSAIIHDVVPLTREESQVYSVLQGEQSYNAIKARLFSTRKSAPKFM